MSSKPAYRRQGRVLAGASVAALVGAATTLSAMPAHADALQDWGYDTQTQALTLTLPDTVMPTVSIVAPDQLVMELPNTQVGDVMGQTVDDGLVESILVEQATPETVWLVMEFAEGTVLSTDQSAVPLAETAAGDQQWQLRPAFVAASRRAAESTPVAVVPTPPVAAAEVPAATGSSASDLRAPERVAQVPDFSDLPVLEPAVIADEPVSVPPLQSAPVAAPTVFVPAVPETVVEQVPEPVAEPVAESAPSEVATDSDAIAVEVIPADSAPSSPVVSVPAADEPVAAVVPEEPPFIEVAEEPVEPAFIEADAIAIPAVPAEPSVAESPAAAPPVLEPVPSERIASEPRLTDEQVRAAQFDNEPIAEAPQVIEQAPFEQVTPANVSRWPEPIPFGQPLPQ